MPQVLPEHLGTLVLEQLVLKYTKRIASWNMFNSVVRRSKHVVKLWCKELIWKDRKIICTKTKEPLAKILL